MIDRLRQFYFDLQHTVYDPEYYGSIHQRHFVDGLWNLAIFGVIAGVSFVLALSIAIFPQGTFGNIKDYVMTSYPDDLELSIQDGVISKNIPGPYIIPLRSEKYFQGQDIANLLVIDTDEGVTADDLERYKTIVLVTNNRIIARDDFRADPAGARVGDSFRTIRASDLQNRTINENTVEGFFEHIKPVYYIILVTAPVLIVLFFTAALSLTYLVLSLGAALLVLIVSKIYDLEYAYRDAYIVAMYVLIPVIVYDLVTDILGFGNYFSVGALIFLAVLIVNFRRKNEHETV